MYVFFNQYQYEKYFIKIMNDIPKRFPEYSIMYKTILNQIKKLEKEDKSLEIQNKIKIYTLELKKIEDMFPKDFFEKYN